MGFFDRLLGRKPAPEGGQSARVDGTSAVKPGCMRCEVDFDDIGVICRRPNGTAESVKWTDLRAVIIQTTSQGPFVDDVFWVLVGETGGCIVPSESVGMDAFVKRVISLCGFDHETMIQAMTCAEDREFLCWKATVGK